MVGSNTLGKLAEPPISPTNGDRNQDPALPPEPAAAATTDGTPIAPLHSLATVQELRSATRVARGRKPNPLARCVLHDESAWKCPRSPGPHTSARLRAASPRALLTHRRGCRRFRFLLQVLEVSHPGLTAVKKEAIQAELAKVRVPAAWPATGAACAHL